MVCVHQGADDNLFRPHLTVSTVMQLVTSPRELIMVAMALITLLPAIAMHIRLTEKPLRLGFQLIESATNTFTTAPLNLPTIPQLSLTIGKGGRKAGIGIEIMKIRSEMASPSNENGQNNTRQVALLKGPAPVAADPRRANSNRVIWTRQNRITNQELTGIGEIFNLQEDHVFDDLTDGDGNGEIVADNEIHIVVIGVGNSSVTDAAGYLLYHLVELSTDEAIAEMIETALA